MEPVQIAIVGLGGWGRNHVRTMTSLSECRVKYIHDLSAEATQAQLRLYPNLNAARSYEEILADDAVRAVIIATSAPSHFALARQALEAGKDIFVEKPMTLHMDESRALCQLADEKNLLIQVGHLLLFHPAVQYLKELIATGELGDIYYIYCQRLNLGIVRSDENSLWSLAPHDISLCNYLLDGHPEQIKATGGCYLQKGIEDVIFVTMGYPGGRIAHVHVSWLDPHKTRRLTIVGSKKMVVFDDMETTEKVRIYDKGVSRLEYENFGESLSIRTGNILIPSVPNQEPLKLQAQHFIECVRKRRRPLVDGREGLSVVEALNRASEELAG